MGHFHLQVDETDEKGRRRIRRGTLCLNIEIAKEEAEIEKQGANRQVEITSCNGDCFAGSKYR